MPHTRGRFTGHQWRENNTVSHTLLMLAAQSPAGMKGLDSASINKVCDTVLL